MIHRRPRSSDLEIRGESLSSQFADDTILYLSHIRVGGVDAHAPQSLMAIRPVVTPFVARLPYWSQKY